MKQTYSCPILLLTYVMREEYKTHSSESGIGSGRREARVVQLSCDARRQRELDLAVLKA